MARTARKRSETGIYHIMLRGIDRREIFLEEDEGGRGRRGDVSFVLR